MGHYIVTSLVLVLVVLTFFVFPQRFSSSSEVIGQKRGARVTAPAAVPKGAIDYSKTPFSHTSRKEHQEICSTCHKVPTKNWQTVKRLPAVAPFPDVANFPDHAACVRCHRAQFFKGAQPGICSDCHTKPISPKNGNTLDFLKPRPSQFAIRFPHDRHQDVLAAFAEEKDKDKPAKFNNCEICHLADKVKPITVPARWSETESVPPVAFKTAPEGHDSCFNCHWKSQKPIKDDCEGCHVKPGLVIPPASAIRISPKFIHSRSAHGGECTSCHINITKSTTLRGLKADVPISACIKCHNDSETKKNPPKTDFAFILKTEMTARAKDKAYVCSYCHTADKGQLEPVPDHYHAVGMKPKDQK